MSLPDTTVVHGHHADLLPTLQVGINGSLIQVLKAVLVDGWGETPVMAMTFDGATAMVTATFAEEHYFTYKQVIEVTGANEPEYNGRWRIAERPTSHEVKFQIGNVPSGDATGTLYMKVGAAGWTMPYISADELVAYFKPQPVKNGNYALRVQDDHLESETNVFRARAIPVLDFTDEVTYTPVSGISETYCTIHLGGIDNAYTNSPWVVGTFTPYIFVANPHMFYLGITYHPNYNGYEESTAINAFGYLASSRNQGDLTWAFTYKDTGEAGYESNHATNFLRGSSAGDYCGVTNPSTNESEGGRTLYPLWTMGSCGPLAPASGVLRYQYPIDVYLDGGTYEYSGTYVGLLPGVGHLLHRAKAVPTKTIIDTEDGAFMHFVAVPYSGNGSTYYLGSCLFLLDKPWPTEV